MSLKTQGISLAHEAPCVFNDNFTGSRFLLGVAFREFRFFFVCLREKPELPEKGRVTSFMEALMFEDKIEHI